MQTYTLAEVRNGTGWAKDTRFIVVPETIKIVIACDGGLVQDVTANIPMEYAMVDYDVEGADTDRLTAIPQVDVIGTPKQDDVWAYAYIGNADVLPERVDQIFNVL